jgi:XTP/dITP diphosphohydrolase
MKIVIATNNKGKVAQFREIFKDEKGITFLTLADINYTKEMVEKTIDEGGTFEENSFIKANQICTDTGYIAVADDSGLIVDALNGRPGLDTALYAGGHDAPQIVKLNTMLDELKNVEPKNRTAKFVCHITCCFPDGKVIRTNGEVKGKIGTKILSIQNGFGFDPIFIPDGYDKTLSELTTDERVKINHRGKAVRAFLKEIKKSYNIQANA